MQHLFQMETKGEGGATRRATLQQVYRSTGKRPAALDGPKIPQAVAHVWGWFQELNMARTYAMSANPISYSEIQAWSALSGNRPAPHEVQMLRSLDSLWLKHFGEKK